MSLKRCLARVVRYMIIFEYYLCVLSCVHKLEYCVIPTGGISGGAGSLPYWYSFLRVTGLGVDRLLLAV